MKNRVKQNKSSKPRRINFSKYPYRGIFENIAKSEGVTRQAINQSYRIYRNPRIIELVMQQINHIDQVLQDHNNAMGAQ
jgi:hypothetical protein